MKKIILTTPRKLGLALSFLVGAAAVLFGGWAGTGSSLFSVPAARADVPVLPPPPLLDGSGDYSGCQNDFWSNWSSGL